MKKIGFIGVGIMGKSMVRNLMKAGFELHIYARNKAKVEDVIEEGAFFHDTIGGCVKEAEAVITIVGYPKDVTEVYMLDGNIFDSAKPGTYLIDMTTSSPTLAKKLHEEGGKKGLHVLDAPVTGGDFGAKAGTLSILVGGDKKDFEACKPIFEAMGTNINYFGTAGSGQHTKLTNQIILAGTISGICEALAYAKVQGLDLEKVFSALRTGAAGGTQFDNLGPKMISGDYAPGFFLKHFNKDMRLAVSEADAKSLELEVLKQTLSSCNALEEEGFGELGNQSLIKHYKELI